MNKQDAKKYSQTHLITQGKFREWISDAWEGLDEYGAYEEKSNVNPQFTKQQALKLYTDATKEGDASTTVRTGIVANFLRDFSRFVVDLEGKP